MTGRRIGRAVAVGVATWLLLAGCGTGTGTGGDGGGSSGGEGGGARTPRVEQQTETGGEAADGLAGPVSLHIGGGVAGVDEEIEVLPGGEVRVSGRAARELTGHELTVLEEELAAVDFGRVPGRVVNPNAADLFQYRLAYGEHTVLTDRSRSLGPVDTVIGRLETYLHDREDPGRGR